MQERELDQQIKRRRLELQQAALPYDHPQLKRLRVYIYSTHSHQPGQQQRPRSHQQHQVQEQDGAKRLQEPPQWTLCLWGRVVELTDPPPTPASDAAAMLAAAQATLPSLPAPPNQPQQQQSKHHPFTSFFKRIEVQLDAEQYPDDAGLFVWERVHHRCAVQLAVGHTWEAVCLLTTVVPCLGSPFPVVSQASTQIAACNYQQTHSMSHLCTISSQRTLYWWPVTAVSIVSPLSECSQTLNTALLTTEGLTKTVLRSSAQAAAM